MDNRETEPTRSDQPAKPEGQRIVTPNPSAGTPAKSRTGTTASAAIKSRTGTAPRSKVEKAVTPGAGPSPVTTPVVNVEPVTSEVSAPYREQLPKAKEIQSVVTNQSALVILALLDGIASMLFGPEAIMQPAERQMLGEPLERMLSRIEITQTEAVKKFTDPILFIMGLIAWGSRVYRQKAAQRPKETPIQVSQHNEDQPGPQAPPPPRNNGNETYAAGQDIKSMFGGGYMTTQERPA